MGGRDPRQDPHEGDVVLVKKTFMLVVDMVRDGEIYFRRTDDEDAFLGAGRCTIDAWREAMKEAGR